MKIIKHIKEGEALPFWYGAVGIKIAMDGYIEIAPIPLNYLLKFWYFTIRKTKFSHFDRELLDARDAGWREGYEAGRKAFNEHESYMVQAWKKLLRPIAKPKVKKNNLRKD